MVPHIAVVFEFSTLNGGERSMLAVMRTLLADKAARFSAIAPSGGDLTSELQRLQIPLLPFTNRDELGKKLSPAELHKTLFDLIDAVKPDVVHSNSLSMSRLLGQLPWAGVRVPRTGHLRDIIKLNPTVIRDLNANHRLVAVSEATRRFHVAQGLDADRCVVIHNGVDLNLFSPRNAVESSDHPLLELPPGCKVLLCAGQICLRKGQHVLAKAVCQLLHDRSDVHLLIAGERHSAKQESIQYEQAIRNEFDAISKGGHLHMPGFCNDMTTLMNSVDMLVHASHQEPFGRTLLEAAASGLPIIATNVGGTPELLRNGLDAILVQAGNPDQLEEAITKLIDHPDLASSLAVSARQRIEELFTIETAARNLLGFWRSTIEQ